MINIDANIKYIFFDVDGVLSAPSYFDSDINSQVIGFSDQGWNKYLNKEKENAYKDCKPLIQIIEFINQLLDSYCSLYVLSATENQIEADSKTVFLNNNYPHIFKEYYYVKNDNEKIEFIENFCKENNIEINNCLIVDDTYSLLLQAHCKGICSTHISNILANNITK